MAPSEYDGIQAPSGNQVKLYPDLTTDFGAMRLQTLAVVKICTDNNGGMFTATVPARDASSPDSKTSRPTPRSATA
jgi:hypothetical protein